MRISVTLLQYEHGILRQALDVLAEVSRNDRLDYRSEDVKELIRFLTEFIDEFHHAKEEKCFYPKVIKEFPNLKRDVEEVFEEHGEAEILLRDTSAALERGSWDELRKNTSQLVRHMVAHVEKEEDHIFPEVDDWLPLEIDNEINESYNEFVFRFGGDDYYRKAETFSDEIQDRLLGAGVFCLGIL